MKILYNPSRTDISLVALVLFIAGLLFCFFDTSVLTIGTRILGIGVIAIGVWDLYTYFFAHTGTGSALIFGILASLFGCVMAISPESIIASIPVLAGILLIVVAAMELYRAFQLKKFGAADWMIILVISCVFLVCGVLLMLRPIQTLAFILKLVGTALILLAAFILFSLYEYTKYSKPAVRQ